MLFIAVLATGCAEAAPDDAAETAEVTVDVAAVPATTTTAVETQPSVTEPPVTEPPAPIDRLTQCEQDMSIADGSYDVSALSESCAGWRVGSPEEQCSVVIRSGNSSASFEDIALNPEQLAELDAIAEFEGCWLYESMSEARCSEDREHPTRQYSWRPSQDDREAVRQEVCGARLRTLRCPRESENASVEYRYDPALQDGNEAQAEHCGHSSATCSDHFEHAGIEYTYLPDRQTAREARVANCGEEFKRGSWNVRTLTDPLRGNVGDIATLYGRWLGSHDWTADDRPEMGVQCRSDKLGIWVHTGGYVGTAYRRGVQVEYRFGDSTVVAQDWSELIRGSDSSVGAWMQDWQRRSFVDVLRRSEGENFVIAVYGYDGAAVGVASFDMTGIRVSVEPILTECGW